MTFIVKKTAAELLKVHPKTLERWNSNPDFAERSGLSRDRSGRVVYDSQKFQMLSELSDPAAIDEKPKPQKKSVRNPEIDPAFVSVHRAAEIYGLPKAFIRDHMAARIGRRLFVNRFYWSDAFCKIKTGNGPVFPERPSLSEVLSEYRETSD